MDDASKGNAGERLKEVAEQCGGEAKVVRLEKPRYYHAGIYRNTLAIKHALGMGPFSAYMKIDTDTFFLSPALEEILEEVIREKIGLAGYFIKMRPKDSFALITDCLPLGFKRKMPDGYLIHDLGLRVGSVQYARHLRKYVLSADRFRYTVGGCIVFSNEVLQTYARSGYTPIAQESTGAIFGEDVLFSVIAISEGLPTLDLSTQGTMWGGDELTPVEIEQKQYAFVHPIKKTDQMQRLWEHFYAASEAPIDSN